MMHEEKAYSYVGDVSATMTWKLRFCAAFVKKSLTVRE